MPVFPLPIQPIATGTAPTPVALPPTVPDFPANHARIGYENLTPLAAVTAPSGVPAAVKTLNTYERWVGDVADTLTITLPVAQPLDYIGIAAHNLGSANAVVEVSVAGLSVATLTGLSDDSAIMILFPVVTESVITIEIVSADTLTVEIGVVFVGRTLQMQRPLTYGGHTPITLSAQTVINPAKSEGGQFLSREIIRRGLTGSASFKNLDPQWVRDYFMPFVESAKSNPFFLAWRPVDYPNEVAYCWTSGDIAPNNSGTRRLMDVDFDVSAHA